MGVSINSNSIDLIAIPGNATDMVDRVRHVNPNPSPLTLTLTITLTLTLTTQILTLTLTLTLTVSFPLVFLVWPPASLSGLHVSNELPSPSLSPPLPLPSGDVETTKVFELLDHHKFRLQ